MANYVKNANSELNIYVNDFIIKPKLKKNKISLIDRISNISHSHIIREMKRRQS